MARWMQWVHDSLMANRISSVSGGEIRKSSRGVSLVFKPGKGGVTETTGLTFRGEFVPGNSYSVNDVVVIFTGAATGTYVCVQATSSTPVPYSDPQHGTYWISLPMGSTVGAWT